MKRFLVIAAAGMSLAACTSPSEIGRPPRLSPVSYAASTIPPDSFPAAPGAKRFSLWDDRQSRLFTDPRAFQQGDILTVLISINDEAKLKNENDRQRTGSRSFDISGAFKVGTQGSSGSGNIAGNSDSKFQGDGHTTRSEDIKLQVAAIVTTVLPNGNLIIKGSQEVRVNEELRVLTIEGIVRPSDIDGNNTISYERIAEARISYGGRGRITEVTQPSWGHQVIDDYSPF